MSLEKGKFVLQTSLSEIPFKPDQVSFCTPNTYFSSKIFWDRKYGNVLGNSLPVGPTQQTTQDYLKCSGCPQKIVMHMFLHKVFPGMLQVIISNGLVPQFRETDSRSGHSFREETRGRFRKRAGRFWRMCPRSGFRYRGRSVIIIIIRMYPRSCFSYRGTFECTLVPVFAQRALPY